MGQAFVTGHRGLLGSAVLRRLAGIGAHDSLICPRVELDLRDLWAVDRWFVEHQPDYVYHCAGTVGGILANSTRPVDFFADNALMHLSVLRAAWRSGVKKLLYVGSSCIYPRDCPQPMREEYLLSGPLGPTNEAYALAKITGVRSCSYYRKEHGCNFISAMPTNLYGPGDNFDLHHSHVLPALMRRFHEAKIESRDTVTIWGSGQPRRELMHVDDLAAALTFLMEHYDGDQHINVGTGEEVTIAELADLIRAVVYPEAKVVFDRSKPDGTPRKLLDVSRLHALGWRHSINLENGVRETYDWFQANYESLNRSPPSSTRSVADSPIQRTIQAQ